MSSALAFVVIAAGIIALPYMIWRWSRATSAIPLVAVQILVGVVAGPSVAGHLEGLGVERVLTTSVAQFGGIGSIAVLIFMFLSGMHFDVRVLRHQERAMLKVAACSIVVPFLLGALAGGWLYQQHQRDLAGDVTIGLFSAAVGICAAVTALPVLAAILNELNITRSRLGQWALGIAAFSDAFLWICLGGLLKAASSGGSVRTDLLLGLAFLGAYMLLFVPILRRGMDWLIKRRAGKDLDDVTVVWMVTLAFVSAAMTELLGFHHLLGAFVAGAVTPPSVRSALSARLEGATVIVLMPFFFVLTGLKTDIAWGSSTFVVALALIGGASFLGKMAGTAIPHRLAGNSWREGLALGSLVQTKGLMEVVVVTILLDAGIITTTMFSVLIVMGLLCTALTAPLIKLIQHADERDVAKPAVTS